MKVAMVLRGGLIHYSAELANGLSAAGAEVLVLCPDSYRAKIEFQQFVEEVLSPDIKRVFVTYPPTTNLRHAASNINVIYRLVRELSAFKPDVIHLNTNHDYRIYLALRLLARHIPFIYMVHDAKPHLGESWDRLWYALHRSYLARASRVVCASRAVRDTLIHQGISEDRIDLVRHGVRSFFRKWLDPTISDDGRTVLFFGRMNRYKGLEVFLDAIPMVQRCVPDARFILAGEGEEIQARAEECKAIKNVEVIAARVPDQEVPNLFARSTVVALPYLEASQSGITMIAYALGKAVVVSDVGGLAEDVEHGVTGLVVPPGDPERLAEALVGIIQNADFRHRLEANVKELAEGERSGRSAAENMLKSYQRAVEHHRRRRRISLCTIALGVQGI